VNYLEVIEALQELRPSGYPIKVYVGDGELYDISSITAQGSDDPDVEPAIVIRCE
jgi:hypothetical protein